MSLPPHLLITTVMEYVIEMFELELSSEMGNEEAIGYLNNTYPAIEASRERTGGLKRVIAGESQLSSGL